MRRKYVNLKEKLNPRPKKMGRERKLPTKDEFLLTLMKLRLDLQTTDLCVRFDVPERLCSNIFKSWLQVMGEYLKDFVFIETPKNLELQSTMERI